MRSPPAATWSGPGCRRSLLQALPRSSSRPDLLDHDRGADQRQVAKPLREVAGELAAGRVDLLAVEPDVIGQGDQLVHQLDGLVELPLAGECLGEPERAGDEGSLAAREPIIAAVAPDVGTLGELTAYRGDRIPPATLRVALIAVEDTEQEARV